MNLPGSSTSFPIPSAPVASTSSTPLASAFNLDRTFLDGRSSLHRSTQEGQDTTLAARRLLKTAKGRPPMVRRRSRSLDEARSAVTSDGGPIRIDPTPYLDSRKPPTDSSTPFSASSFSTDATTVPNSGISSSCATIAPSPYIRCPPTPCFPLGESNGGVFTPPTISRSLSDSALELVSDGEQLYRPVYASISNQLSKSFSTPDNRLSSWIKVTSSPFAASSSVTSVAEPLPTSTDPLRHHQFAPVFPSPLSESYTSDDGRPHVDDGFPFPSTPVLPSFPPQVAEVVVPNPQSTTTAVSPSHQSLRSVPSKSSMIARTHLRAHTFASISQPASTSSPVRAPLHRSSSLPSSNTPASSPAPGQLTQVQRSIPLTPPDSIGNAPYLAGVTRSELAWQDVLGSRIGLDSILPAIDQAQVSSIKAEGAWGKGGSGTRNVTPRLDARSPEERELEGRKPGGLVAEGLMGGGHFATATRERMTQLLQNHIGDVLIDKDESVVQIVEYGAIHSRSSTLVKPIVSHFVDRHAELLRKTSLSPGVVDAENDEISFSILHTDKTATDFGPLAQILDDTTPSTESYLHSTANLDGRIFSSFSARPFGSKVVPKASVSVGFSAMSLHWPSTDRKYQVVAPATLAHGELMAFLSARAFEFKAGGLLTLAFIGRSEDYVNAASPAYSPHSSSPSTPSASPTEASTNTTSKIVPPTRKRDLWSISTSVLGKAIQRLVSTGLLKPQVARQLLALPLHPRTPQQTLACVRASSHSWELLHSSLVPFSHPAWKGVEHGTVSPSSWSDYTIQLMKVFWESEMRAILKPALGSRGACEWVLDCLWTVAKEKIEEDVPHPLELEIQFLALRRRPNRSGSTPPSPTLP